MKDGIKFSIPELCPENWDKMHPEEQGRFCDKCCKVVVDFTSKTTSEILDFLKTAGKKSVCGNVHEDQLSLVPVRITRSKRRSLFFAAIYFVFGSLLFTACHSRRHSQQVRGAFLVEPATAQKKEVNPVLLPDRK